MWPMISIQDYRTWSLKMPIKCKYINKRESSHVPALQSCDSAKGRWFLQLWGVRKEILPSHLTLCVCLFKPNFFQMFHSIREERKGGDNKLNLHCEQVWMWPVYFKEEKSGWERAAQLSLPKRQHLKWLTCLSHFYTPMQ